MEMWGLAGDEGVKAWENKALKKNKEGRWLPLPRLLSDSFLVGGAWGLGRIGKCALLEAHGQQGVHRGHHLTLEKWGEVLRRAKRRGAVEVGVVETGKQSKDTRKSRKFSPEPEPRKTHCRWDKATSLIDMEEEDGGPRAREVEGTAVRQEGSASCQRLWCSHWCLVECQ